MAELKSKLQEGKSLREYYPVISREWLTPKEARKEYNRLRAIANKRYEALERHFPTSMMAFEYRGGFPSITNESDQRIYNRLYNVAKYLELKMSSVTGQREYRKKAIASLHESGYDFINQRNFDLFTAFMDEVRLHSDEKEVASKSEQIVDLFERVLDEGADPEEVARDFNYWLKNEGEHLPDGPKKREKIRKRQAGTPYDQTAGRRGQAPKDSRPRSRSATKRSKNRIDRRRGRRR